MASEIKVDTISEKTSAGGVTIDGVLLKDTQLDIGDSKKLLLGASDDLTLYHDGSNSYITNSTGALKIATETSGIAITIGHTTSETTIADNLTTTGTLTVGSTSITANGITAASQWRVTANFTGDAAPIASNWEVSDSTGYASLGSAMSESSGIFTFPSTGYWLVLFQGTMTSNSSENECGYRLQVTTDNSSYDAEGEAVASGSPGGSNETGSAQTAAIVDVTDVANVKVRFAVFQADDSNTTIGSSTRHLTGATFIRLGDT